MMTIWATLTPFEILQYLVLAVVAYRCIKLFRRKPAPFPPGPRGLPILENILDMPTYKEWETFSEWAGRYGQYYSESTKRSSNSATSYSLGDIASISIMGRRIVVVNSAKIASEMLDRKSVVYSDRPAIQMAGELVGWRDALPCLPYDHRFRNQRRMIHQVIGTNAAVASFNPMLEKGTKKFLRRVLEEPSGLLDHVRK